MSFMQRHAAEFDAGGVAVRGDGCTLIPVHLLRAVHALICPVAADPDGQLPRLDQVRELAETFFRVESKQSSSSSRKSKLV